MTRNRENSHEPAPDAVAHATALGDGEAGFGADAGLGVIAGGGTAADLLEAAIDPIVADMGYELLLVEWLASGKHRVLRVYLDHPDGITLEDVTRMGRVIGNGLDAIEANAHGNAHGTAPGIAPERSTADADAAGGGQGTPVDPALAALLGRTYTLEVSSPGIDRPLAKRRHFEAQIGCRAKIKTSAPPSADSDERSFHGRIVAVVVEPEDGDDQRRGTVVLHDPERDRTLDIPLPLIRRANLVWEG